MILGLSSQEVDARRAAGQVNAAPPATSRSYWQIARENVFTFINNALFLLGLGLVLVGRPMDALISVGVIMINIVVSVVQEIRAKRILDRIALLTRPTATVVRNGQEHAIGPEELVLDDVLKVGPGDQILVDGTVIQGKMSVDESQLTGESELIDKEPGERLFSGSYCASGSGYYRAEQVGEESFANKLTAGARAFRRVYTPLQQQINLTIRIMLAMVIYLELLVFLNGLINALPLPDGVEQATIIAGLVPNGLFVSIAVAYALGAVRIVRFGALVQQSNAIESLSNVDILCLDKTGTLTTNRLMFYEACAYGISQERLETALGTMMASVTTHNKTSQTLRQAFPGEAQPLQEEVQFSSARKWSAVACSGDSEWPSGPRFHGVYILGAPAVLGPYLEASARSSVWPEMHQQMQAWAARGLRVLMVAHHPDPEQLRNLGDASQLPDGITPVGLVSLSDELREEAQDTLRSFISHGVAPKIISGDSPETVAALARQAGLNRDISLISGAELEEMNESEFEAAADTATVFGRITPQQKEKLVEALRRRKHYVAMIGDGVNDVLSLKKADLGIAMQSGSQATRGVADIILMNDSFAALAPAVAEGQRIVNGMQDILKLFLARIATMALVIMSALIIGVFPINIRHGSLVTLLTVGIPTVVLAVWARPGYRDGRSLVHRLAHFVIPAAVVSSMLGLVVFYGPYLVGLSQLEAGLPPVAQLAAIGEITLVGQTSLATFLAITGLLLVVFVEPPTEWWTGADTLSGDWRPTLLVAALFLVAITVMAVPGLRDFFSLQPLTPLNLLLIVGAVFVWLALVRTIWRQRWLERFFEFD